MAIGETHRRVVRPGFERHDGRGSLIEILNHGAWSTILCGTMRPGSVMGQHYHRRTSVFFFVTSGAARVRVYDVRTGEADEFALGPREGVLFGLWETHAITFTAETSYVMLKDRPYDPADPDTFSHPVPERN